MIFLVSITAFIYRRLQSAKSSKSCKPQSQQQWKSVDQKENKSTSLVTLHQYKFGPCFAELLQISMMWISHSTFLRCSTRLGSGELIVMFKKSAQDDLWPYHLNVEAEIKTHQTRQRFSSLLLWACVNCSLRFLFLGNRSSRGCGLLLL